MRKGLSSIVAIIFIFAKYILDLAGAIMDIIGLPDLANSITSLLNRPDGSTDYLGLMFWGGICLLIIINWPFIKKLTWHPKQKKEPITPKEQSKETDPIATLIEEIKQSDSWYVNLTRKLEFGAPYVIFLLEIMRRERNHSDFTTLVEIYRTSAGKWTNYIPDLEKELRFIIDCMERLSYIELEAIPGRENVGVLQGKHGAFCGGDKAIKFSDKYLEKFSSINI